MRTLRTIRNCRRWKARCSRTWDSLVETDEPRVRFCDGCEKNVYFCSTDAETIEHALAGDCVAREEPAREELPRMVIGRPRVPIQVTPTQREARVWNKRERGIDKVLDGRVEASRRCPSCSYPVLSFRKTCYVCGHEVGRAE